MPMLYIEWQRPLPFIAAGEDYRFSGGVCIAKFVPNVRIVRRHVSQANCRTLNAFFDSSNHHVRSRILIDPVCVEAGLAECRLEGVLVSLVELASIEGLNYETRWP